MLKLPISHVCLTPMYIVYAIVMDVYLHCWYYEIVWNIYKMMHTTDLADGS